MLTYGYHYIKACANFLWKMACDAYCFLNKFAVWVYFHWVVAQSLRKFYGHFKHVKRTMMTAN